jgi:hypothetical protein
MSSAIHYHGFHQHSGANIHERGVVEGDGIGGLNMFEHADEECADLGKRIGGAATGVWHSLFG